MSVRRALIKLWSTGRYLIRPPAQAYHTGAVALPKNQVAKALGGTGRASVSRVQQGYDTARRIFASSLLSRVSTNVSAELRNRTTRQLLLGNSTPFFAFVGLSLATGSIITKEDELEGLCMEIRSSIERLHKATAEAESDLFAPNETVGIHNFTFGPYIGKGANAAIYCAKKKDNIDSYGPEIQGHMPRGLFPFAIKMIFNYGVESNAFLIMNKMANEALPARMVCTKIENDDDQPAIETIMNETTLSLPPHPNVVSMHSALADYVPEGLPEALSEIPEALPMRLHSEGLGRNMTMFLIMKRYDTNLKDYLKDKLSLPGTSNDEPPDVRESVLLLAQLLEGIAHINRHGIAHRDLKTDNLLLDLVSEGDIGPDVPRLVLTDFGSCFRDPDGRLLLPFHTRHTDRGGNAALMAPEVGTATPGPFTFIDYSKSDVWAAGAIAYELFTGVNPFYNRSAEGSVGLSSRTYQEKDLPALPNHVPEVVRRLVRSLLSRSPNKRPSADLAADVLQLHLWAPSSWTKADDCALPSYEILQWLLTLTTKVLTTDSFGGRRSQAEYQLISSFLRRIKLERVRCALNYIQRQ